MFVVAQLGARRHYAVPRILEGAGILEHLYTDLVAVRGWPKVMSALGALGRVKGSIARMIGRVPEGISPDRITHWPSFAIEYFIRQRKAESPAEVSSAYLWAGKEFCRRIIRSGLGNANSVYTYNSAGLEVLEYARARGLFCVVDQTIAPVRVEDRLLAQEYSAWPDWEVVVHGHSCRAALAAREQAEWDCANLILCGSEFVRSGIVECGGPADRCAVVPYGASTVALGGRQHPRAGGKLRVLVGGGVGLRKGAPYVLRAARETEGLAKFRWCGNISIRQKAAKTLNEFVDLRGPVPRPQMAEQYAWANVFLLPSICEGSAAVCYEALAAGLPVITTPNAGSVVRDGVEGFIVPVRDPEAIAAKIELLACTQDLWEWMSRNAQTRAWDFTVEKYGERLVAAIHSARAAREGSADGQLLTCIGE